MKNWWFLVLLTVSIFPARAGHHKSYEELLLLSPDKLDNNVYASLLWRKLFPKLVVVVDVVTDELIPALWAPATSAAFSSTSFTLLVFLLPILATLLLFFIEGFAFGSLRMRFEVRRWIGFGDLFLLVLIVEL